MIRINSKFAMYLMFTSVNSVTTKTLSDSINSEPEGYSGADFQYGLFAKIHSKWKVIKFTFVVRVITF